MLRCGCALQRVLPRHHGIPQHTRSLSQHIPSSPSTSRVIFSGIQPTGIPHLGNYLGALRQWVTLQNNSDPSTTLIYSLVDLHAITLRQPPAQLRQWKRESLAMLLAIGLDPKRSTIFHQSTVPAHAELMWILSCQASTGYLGRMTQWKDKTSGEREGSEKLKLGLFSYPVLQAADVLVHGATHVPVGEDQAQHLEFAREVARGFNHVYGNERGPLVVPETIISSAKRVMSLTDPDAKMSKSHPNPRSRILLTDSAEEIKGKINAAITDSIAGVSYDPVQRIGVSNLIDILYHCTEGVGFADQVALAKDMDSSSLRVVKQRVSDAVESQVRPIRERYQEIVDNPQLLEEASTQGTQKGKISANATLAKVKLAIGLT
ncbi:Tryptophan--tRNA ligase, mitochondrial [Oleoguttula sp. CCFEE 5521]